MSDLVNEARGHLEAGDTKRALNALWRARQATAAQEDASTLDEIATLAVQIQRSTRGGTQRDAGFLADWASRDARRLAPRPARPEPTAPTPSSGGISARIDELERRLDAFRTEIAELRALAAADTAPSAPLRPAPAQAAPRPVQPPPPRPPVASEREWAPPRPPQPPRPEREPERARPLAAGQERLSQLSQTSVSDLLGARALAWAGGVVTLLGIVFFFVLAVDRGWVSQELRCFLGAAVSAAVYGFGLVVRRRYGNLQAALAGAGAGIGGAYATLFAATAMYDFLSEPVALLAAAGVAAVGVATALVWNAQTPAALGLVGAMAGALLIEEEPSVLGAGFVAVLLAAALAVTLRRDWVETAAVAGLAALLEVGLLFADRDPGRETEVAALLGVFALLYAVSGVAQHARAPERDIDPGLRGLSAAAFVATSVALVLGVVYRLDSDSPLGPALVVGGFWLLYLAIAVAYQLRAGGERLDRLVATLAVASAGVAFGGAHTWFEEQRNEGYALLVVAAVTLAPLAALRGRGQRDLTSLLWATGLSVAAVAGGYLLSDERLALAWAAQGALLSYLAVRVREARLQLAALAYLTLAAAVTLGWEATPASLFREDPTPAGGIPSILFLALGAAAFAYSIRRQPDLETARPVQDIVIPSGRDLSLAAALSAALLALYAASFGVLALFQWALPDDGAGIASAFERGHASMTALWWLVALAILGFAILRGSSGAHWAAMGLFGVAAAKVAIFDLGWLSDTNRAYSLLAAGGVALAAGFLYGLRGDRVSPWSLADVELHPFTVTFVLLSAGALTAAAVELLDGTRWGVDLQGAGLLAVAAVFAALAASIFGRPGYRDLTTLLWAPAVAFAFGGFAGDLLDGRWLVLAWAATAGALAYLAWQTDEERLLAGSLAVLSPAVAYTLSLEARPGDFFLENAHPATGVPAVVFVALAAFGLAAAVRPGDWRRRGFWAAGTLAVYAASLSILGLFQWGAADDAGSVATAFQRGHTAVSSFWGILGLVLLAVGLRRGWTAFRLGGLALFGVALAKIFLYDLSTLSSMARALSFLGVGSVLLLAAFLYQRLTEDRRGEPPPPRPPAGTTPSAS
jgi:uncharacterized membrane protein